MKKLSTTFLFCLFTFLFLAKASICQLYFEKTYMPGTSSMGLQVEQSEDNEYFILGSYEYGYTARYFIKTDSLGDTIWVKHFENAEYSLHDFCFTSDNGFLLVGGGFPGTPYNHKSFIMKLNNEGDTLWTKTNYFTDQTIKSVTKTNDDCYILTFWKNTDLNNFHVAKINENGDSLWTQSYSEISDHDDLVETIESSNVGYTILGNSYDSAYIIHTDNLGNKLWFHKYRGIDDGMGYMLNSIIEAENGDYLSAGSISYDMRSDAIVQRVDYLGNLIWVEDWFFCYAAFPICDAGSDNYVIGAYGGLMKINGSGEELWRESYNNELFDVGLSNDNGLIATGYDDNAYGIYLIKTDQFGTLTSIKIEEDLNNLDMNTYPNPFSAFTTVEYQLDHPSDITIHIFNHLGELVDVIQQKQAQGVQQVTWNAESRPAGIYFFRLEADEQVVSGKMVLVR